jgi:hypothetical protein
MQTEIRKTQKKYGLAPAIDDAIRDAIHSLSEVKIKEAYRLDEDHKILDDAKAYYIANKNNNKEYVKIVVSVENDDFNLKGGDVGKENF